MFKRKLWFYAEKEKTKKRDDIPARLWMMGKEKLFKKSRNSRLYATKHKKRIIIILFEIIGTYNISIWFTTYYRRWVGEREIFCYGTGFAFSPSWRMSNFVEPLCWSYLFLTTNNKLIIAACVEIICGTFFIIEVES